MFNGYKKHEWTVHWFLLLGRDVVWEKRNACLRLRACVHAAEGCPTVVSPVCSRKSWTLGTTIVTGSSPDTDGFAFPPSTSHIASLLAPDTQWHLRPPQTLFYRTNEPHLGYRLKNGISISRNLCYIYLVFYKWFNFFPRTSFLLDTHKHTLFTELNIFFPLFSELPLFLPILPDSTKWAYDFDWQPQQTLCPPPSSPPASCFNPLTVPRSLLLRFLFCSEWGSKSRRVSIFSISDCLISRRWHPQLFWHRWWRRRLEQGWKKNGWLVFVVVSFPLPPLLGLVCVDTDTLGWHLHTPDTDACQSYIRRLAGKE